MKLEKFSDKHITEWINAVDESEFSPSPLAGPEYAYTLNTYYKKTYIFNDDDVFIPIAKEHTKNLNFIQSYEYTGVYINSILGKIKDRVHLSQILNHLVSSANYVLYIPLEIYNKYMQVFEEHCFYPQNEYVYHKIDLPSNYDDWFTRHEVKRQNIRRAQREDIVIKIGGVEFLEQFYELYLLAYKRWKESKIANRHHDFDRFKEMFSISSDNLRIANAYSNDKCIASVIFCYYKNVASYIYGGIDLKYQKARPNNLIHSEVIRFLIDQGIKEYNLGASLGIKSLERFKESLGGKKCISMVLNRNRFPRLKKLQRLLQKR